MSKKTTIRIIFSIIFLLAVVWTPWWLIVCIALVGMFYFDWYVEALIGAFIFDSLYGVGGFTNIFFITITGVLLMTLVVLKQWIKIDSSF